jgi:hypothetical protein
MFIEGRQAISRLQLEIKRKGEASQFRVTEEMTFRDKKTDRRAALEGKDRLRGYPGVECKAAKALAFFLGLVFFGLLALLGFLGLLGVFLLGVVLAGEGHGCQTGQQRKAEHSGH